MGYWNNICEIQRKQTEKGLKEYGMTLEDNKSISSDKRITMAEEELIDALMYLEHIKNRESLEGSLCPVCHKETNVYDTKYRKKIDRIVRYRKCPHCDCRYRTIETYLE